MAEFYSGLSETKSPIHWWIIAPAFSDYTDKDIETIQNLLNSTPRKCLGYRTPEEAFIQKIIETSGALEM